MSASSREYWAVIRGVAEWASEQAPDLADSVIADELASAGICDSEAVVDVRAMVARWESES